MPAFLANDDGVTVTTPSSEWDRCMRHIQELEAHAEHLRNLLRRIDDVTVWETTPLGRGFQEEVERAIGIGGESR